MEGSGVSQLVSVLRRALKYQLLRLLHRRPVTLLFQSKVCTSSQMAVEINGIFVHLDSQYFRNVKVY
jgi:hypothetical protein